MQSSILKHGLECWNQLSFFYRYFLLLVAFVFPGSAINNFVCVSGCTFRHKGRIDHLLTKCPIHLLRKKRCSFWGFQLRKLLTA